MTRTPRHPSGPGAVVSFRLSPAALLALDALAVNTGHSRSQVVEDLILLQDVVTPETYLTGVVQPALPLPPADHEHDWARVQGASGNWVWICDGCGQRTFDKPL